MPKQLFRMTKPVEFFRGTDDINFLTEVLKKTAIIEKIGLVFNYLCEGIKGSAAVEDDGLNVTIYLTETRSVKDDLRKLFKDISSEFVWNVFRPHKFGRYEEHDDRIYSYIFLAPQESLSELVTKIDRLQPNVFSKCVGKLVGKLSLHDWLFNSAGGQVEISEVHEVLPDRRLSVKMENKTVTLMNML